MNFGLNYLADQFVFWNLRKITKGYLQLIDSRGNEYFFGDKKSSLKAKLKINNPSFSLKLLRKGSNPHGRCIFFNANKGLCTINKVKPLQCKTSSGHAQGEQLHSWFILNHFVNTDDPESVRQYAGYLKENKTIPGGALLELVPDKIKLRKTLNHEILK